MILQGCGGVGSSAPAPTVTNIVAADSSAIITFTATPGVEYWIFSAAASSITPENCSSVSVTCRTLLGATSPATISGLTNGTTYSFTINGRTGGGKGGPGSPSVFAIPRLAGASWSEEPFTVTVNGNNLRGVTFGTVATAPLFVAVSDAGKIFSSPDGIVWAPQNSGVGTSLNAVTYSNGIYMAVGAGGVVLTSGDAITWTLQTSATAVNTLELLAVAGNGAGGFVATGANGRIINSTTNGTSWAVATVNPNAGVNALNGITFGNSKYVAVGAGGTLQTSTDGNTWLAGVWNGTPAAAALNGVAYAATITADNGITYTTTGATFVVIGANGTLVTSPDGATWTLQTTPVTSSNLNAVAYGRQFVVVGDTGVIFTSANGLSWTAPQTFAPPTPRTSINFLSVTGVTHNSVGGSSYSTVGTQGENWLSL